MDVQVFGAEDIARVAAEVRKLGDGRTIPNRMAKRIRNSVPDAVSDRAKANAVATLPRLNGFGRWVARGKVKALVRRGPRTAGVLLAMGNTKDKGLGTKTKRSDYELIDLGTVRHPSWGRRGVGQWHNQTVRAGFFTDAVEGPGVEEFREAVSAAIGDAVREVFG